MTVSFERTSPHSFAEHVANICVTAAKYSECLCTEPAKPFLNGNVQTTVCGVEMQETDQFSGNAEDEDADKQREPLLLMHNMSNPSVVALSGTPISVTGGEGPSSSRSSSLREMSRPRSPRHLREMLKVFRSPGCPQTIRRARSPCPHLQAKAEDTGSQYQRGGTQMIYEARSGDTTVKAGGCSEHYNNDSFVNLTSV